MTSIRLLAFLAGVGYLAAIPFVWRQLSAGSDGSLTNEWMPVWVAGCLILLAADRFLKAFEEAT